MPTICVLSPGPPSNHMALLVGQLYPALQYIDGDVLLQHDLSRARAESAQAIMVNPTNCLGNTEEVTDHNLVLTAISIFRFYQKIHHKNKVQQQAENKIRERIESSGNEMDFLTAGKQPIHRLLSMRGSVDESLRDDYDYSFLSSLRETTRRLFTKRHTPFILPELCFQVGARKTKDHLRELGMPLHAVANQEFLNALTAVGTLIPGFITFFGNAVRSNPDMDTNKERWRAEYKYGASHEIYIVDVDETTFTKPVFEGLTFSELSKHLMESNGTLLLAVGVVDPSVDSPMGRPSQVLLNPASMVLFREPKLERLFALGQSKESVDEALSDLYKVRHEHVESLLQEKELQGNRRRASLEYGRRLTVRMSQHIEPSPWFIPKHSPEGSTVLAPIKNPPKFVPYQIKKEMEEKEEAERLEALKDLNEFSPLGYGETSHTKREGSEVIFKFQQSVDANDDKVGIVNENLQKKKLETLNTSKLAIEQIDTAMKTLAELGVQVRRHTDIKRLTTGQSGNESLGLVEAAGGMLGAARRAVMSLPDMPKRTRGLNGSLDDMNQPLFDVHTPIHSVHDDDEMAMEEYEVPHKHILDGHLVIEAFSSNVRTIMSILVSVRRYTSLDVAILLSKSNLMIRKEVVHQLNHIKKCRCGRIGDVGIAENVYLLHDHVDLNTDAITEARVGNAVAIIVCRANKDAQTFKSVQTADNHMMVKSSMICQGLVHHYRSATAAASITNDASTSASILKNSRMSVLNLKPNITNHKAEEPPLLSKRGRGPRMSICNSISETGLGGSVEGLSMDGLEVKHFDLHVVHQLFEDIAVSFLGQSTEVPKFDRGNMSSIRKQKRNNSKWELGAGLKKYSGNHEDEENKSSFEDDDDTPPKLPHKISEFGSFQLLDDVDVEKKTVIEEEGDDFFGKNITSKRLAKLYDDALFNYPIFAAGRVFADSLMELLMAQAYFNPNEICFWEAMLGIDEIDREQRFGDEKQGTFEHSMAQLVSFSTRPSQVRV
mmetsp:Transcript_30820/g.39708  ORF Transcript_30820/g.39708 Transcript_30820/m.39708 type:complete len:1001 (+) Transcript_30820:154-3156(+)